ncbi:unnamed protein product [Rotaria sordida]|uniref:Protein translocase subunit SecA n=1 Tax=Rotaria sordida TaxID=392033 RepID=A0A815J358_9BILA|nr:unnamed protein product [Rotaria sordida]
MILKLGFDISKKLLDALQNIDNLREFENLLTFSQQNNIKISDIYVKNKTISILKRSLEIKFLGNQIENVDRLKLGIHLDKLLDQSWTFEQLDHLFKIFKESDNQNKVRYFISVLEILSNCKIHPKDQEKIKLSLKKPVENWPREINKVAVEAIFTEKSQVKTLTDLVIELKKLNSNNQNLKHLTEEILLEWIEKVKNPISNSLFCLIALNSNDTQGRLLQVATGEGKSTIISILAVFYALQGKTVDIITSSPVLAERDAKEKAKFYNMFDLSCSHNNDRAVYLSGPKACYKKEIVYGEVAQFQYDTLRTEYAELNTLGGRKCEFAIVDEVDSMLIDDSSKIARLATTMSGMDQLQIIYHALWNQFCSLQKKIIEIDNKLYLFYGKITLEQKRIILDYPNERGDIVTISDLKTYIESTLDISNIGFCIPENDDGEEIIKKSLEKDIRLFIKKNLKIPKNFEEFLNTQIPKWIENAIIAFNYQKNVHYVVHEELIKPVDYYSTGIVQSSSNWSDGLHQFLQIKHNLKMTSETFTTNFLSNIGYFKKYGSNLFGLTETLGSEKAKDVLSYVYNVDSVIIPSQSQKQHLSFSDIVVDNETEWLKEICYSAINESTGRGTHIKTDEIEEYGGLHVILTFLPSNQRVEEQALGRTFRQGKRGTSQKILNAINFIHYKDFDIKKERDNIEENMLDDFKKHELKIINLKDDLFAKFCKFLGEIRQKIRQNTNLFKNIKNTVKDLIVNVKPSVFEINVLLSIEEQWAMFLRKIDNEKSVIDPKKFCNEYEDFKKRIIDNFKNNCIIKNPYYHIIIGNDLIINDSSLNSKYDEAMKHFDQAIKLDPNHCAAAFVGRGWLLLKGKERIIFSNKQDLGYKDEAVIEFRRALEIFSEDMCLLTSMQTLLQQRCSDVNTSLYKQLLQKVNILGAYCNHIENLINIIRKSQRLIHIKGIISHSNKKVKIISNNTLEKYSRKFCDIRLIFSNCINLYETVIQECKEIIIMKDEEKFTVIYKQEKENTFGKWEVNDHELSERLLSLPKDEKILDRKNYSEIYKQIYEKITAKKGFIRTDLLTPLPTLSNDGEYEVTFNDLTCRKDMITIDQAIMTIDAAIPETNEMILSIFSKTKHPSRNVYKQIRVNLLKINPETLDQLINPNIETKNVTKEIALQQLNGKSSFFHRYALHEDFRLDSYEVNLDIILDDKIIREEKCLQVRNAIDIINKYTENNTCFNLTFLSANEISKVILNKVINHSKLIIEFLNLTGQNVSIKPDLELSEFFGRGIQYLLEINEKNFIPWLSIATIAAIAAVQMAVGGVLIGTGFGLTLGMGLITEGVVDLFTAYGAYRKRQFSWLDYAMHKAVGLVITAASLGISAIKNMGEGAKTVVTAIGEEAIEQITTQTISNERLTTHIVLHIGKSLKRQAIGQMMFWASGRLLGESLMVLNRSSDIGFSFVPDQLKSQISESIQHKVNNVLRNRDLDILLEKMYGIDKINKNQQLKEEIKKITFEVINSQRSFWRKQWDSIGGPLCKGILSNAEKIRNAANMGLIIAGILNTTHEITFILETTREQLLKKLSGFDQENLSVQQILYRYCRFSKDDAKKIANLLERQAYSQCENKSNQ